jgi:hypothetical protein
VQGRLRNEALSFEVETSCGHCGCPIHFSLDSNLNFQVKSEGANPLVFEPTVEWETFREPNIIDGY